MSLWMRIFLYSFLLVLVSQALSFGVFKMTEEVYLSSSVLSEVASDMACGLEDESAETIEAFMEVFSHPDRNLWLELRDGSIYQGRREESYAPDARNRLLRNELKHANRKVVVDIFEGARPGMPLMAKVPVMLQDLELDLCLILFDRPSPPFYHQLVHGLISVCLLGGAACLLIGWRVSRPLRRLCDEIHKITEGDLKARATVASLSEIGEVAEAVNLLADYTSKNITSMRELMANFSHEIRSPLARINITTTLMEDIINPEHARQCAEGRSDSCASGCPERAAELMQKAKTIQAEIDSMSRLVGDSLLSSKLAMDLHEMNFERVEFSELTEEMCRRHEVFLTARNLRFSRIIQPGLQVRGDEPLLCQVLANLLDNSAKYADDDGEVNLRLYSNERYVYLDIENSYKHLEEDVLSRIFEPFYRGGVPTGDGRGVGLGLALVDKIVKRHGGKAEVGNCPLGLVFSVKLPKFEK